MKLLLHCCCAPCSVACLNLAEDGIETTLFWFNPNIHPYTEYQARRDSLLSPPLSAPYSSFPVITVDEYGLHRFLQETAGKTQTPVADGVAERCEICYRMRLEKTAACAAENGFDAFSTTLLISPYQRHEAIRRVGEEAAQRYGVRFFYQDFRPLFRQGQSRSRALGLYMQKYCGCIFSEEERFSNFVSQQYEELTRGDFFQRLALITGGEVLEKLSRTTVFVFGLGGVGSWCAEALVRSGIGKITIIDFDKICESNVNRQVQATSRTLGRSKAETLKMRLLEINPHCEVTAWEKVFSREDTADFAIEKADYVIDAIDSLPHKIDLIEAVCAAGVKLFSSMGMANKIDPEGIKAASIWETRSCPLARLVRQGLRKRGFGGDFTAVYSERKIRRGAASGMAAGMAASKAAVSDNTPARQAKAGIQNGDNPYAGKKINGSVVTVTATAGMALANLVLRDNMEALS